MKGSKQIMVALALTLAVAGSAAPQGLPIWGGRGETWGFRGIGLGNWVLHENGLDSIAAWYGLTDEQRGEFEQLANAFRSENSEALQRWEQMQDEIQSLYTEDQMPTRAAIVRIGEKYNHPSQELRPALDQLQAEAAAILTPEQRLRYGRGIYGRVGAGAGRMDIRGGRMTVPRRTPLIGRRPIDLRGQRGSRLWNRRPGWRPPEN